jgi:hypothetical protein
LGFKPEERIENGCIITRIIVGKGMIKGSSFIRNSKRSFKQVVEAVIVNYQFLTMVLVDAAGAGFFDPTVERRVRKVKEPSPSRFGVDV